MNLLSDSLTSAQLVSLLGDVHRYFAAYERLLAMGAVAAPEIRLGLAHPDELVRENCCKLLDHLMDDDTITDLIRMLDDPSPRVRIAAAHALACDRCKENACRPTAGAVLPPALRLLADDPHSRVRGMVIEVVGQWVDQDERALAGLVAARDHDGDPAVRKKAAWYLPGGAVHRKAR